MPSRVGLGKPGHKTEAKPSTPNESGKGFTLPFLVVILLLFSRVQHLKDLGFYTNPPALTISDTILM
jgi:hypothetical protein